ncbi:hypothetical protein CLU89_3876 [Acidovorax sp. 30]|nr:hypothetical protein CLU89_3876 [Acidovorax sp. 30]
MWAAKSFSIVILILFLKQFFSGKVLVADQVGAIFVTFFWRRGACKPAELAGFQGASSQFEGALVIGLATTYPRQDLTET